MPQRFKLYTTIDITNTGIRNKSVTVDEWDHKRNQQRNYDTLIQVISLRAQPIVISLDSVLIPSNHCDFKVNEDLIRVWEMTIDIEHADVFGKDFELLKNDLHLVPIIPGLDSTVPVFPPMFMTRGEFKNVTIQKSKI